MSLIDNCFTCFTSIPNDIKEIHRRGWVKTLKEENNHKILLLALKILSGLCITLATALFIATPLQFGAALVAGTSKGAFIVFRAVQFAVTLGVGIGFSSYLGKNASQPEPAAGQ